MVGAAQGVVFLGGHPTKLMAYAVEELLTWYPFMPVEKSMQVSTLPACLQPPGRRVRVSDPDHILNSSCIQQCAGVRSVLGPQCPMHCLALLMVTVYDLGDVSSADQHHWVLGPVQQSTVRQDHSLESWSYAILWFTR